MSEEYRLLLEDYKDQLKRNIALENALILFSTDPHRWSKRDCDTCKKITKLFGEPFGCVAYVMKGGQ